MHLRSETIGSLPEYLNTFIQHLIHQTVLLRFLPTHIIIALGVLGDLFEC